MRVSFYVYKDIEISLKLQCIYKHAPISYLFLRKQVLGYLSFVYRQTNEKD